MQSGKRALHSEQLERRFGLWTTTALVVASMVGTGVFTTTGMLVRDLPSAPAILGCWALAGLASLCGALAYAELGAAMPSSGGEYYFLSRLFHPALGFVSAWVSLIVGFSAPLAVIALGFGSYLEALVPIPPLASGALLIVSLSALNAWRVSVGAGFHNVFTAGKVVFMIGFAAFAATRVDPALLTASRAPVSSMLVSPGFAVGLLSVAFAYTGWNAAAYVAGEVKDPARVLPLALGAGTLFVTLLYVALNAVFLGSAPLDQLVDKIAVAEVAAQALYGARGARVVSAIIAIGLVSTANAIVVTGPRIYEAVGRDLPKLGWLAGRSAKGGPRVAVALQGVLALGMMMSARFEELLVYIGFTLSLFAAIAVLGVYRLRARKDLEGGYRMPGYPVTPALFIALSAWMAIEGVVERPASALGGVATIAVGLFLYRFSV